MYLLKTLLVLLVLLCSQGFSANANFNLHCEFSGKVVELADETFPAKLSPDDKVLKVNLHLKGTEAGGFHTTGPSYYAKMRLKDKTILVYLHSAGYGFPLTKTVGVSVKPDNAKSLRLFYTEVGDYGNTVVEPGVLKALGVEGLPEFESALRVVCNDFGSQ